MYVLYTYIHIYKYIHINFIYLYVFVMNFMHVINVIYFMHMGIMPVCYKQFISTMIPLALMRGE